MTTAFRGGGRPWAAPWRGPDANLHCAYLLWACLPRFLTDRQIVSATIAAVPVSFLDERAALAGKVAIVAGGAGGLGRASALDLASTGVSLALADVDGDALRSTAAEARELGV
jgi:hypothetical protein